MDIVEKITTMITPSLDALGYEIVQIKLMDTKRKTLSVMAERKDGEIMSFDDCTAISRTVSALMDVEDPITSAYDLEVMSPGVDRPLVKFSDFVKHVGYEVKLETLIPVNTRKRFKGKLKSAADNKIVMTIDDGEHEIIHHNIRTAKLVMTDELMREFLKKAEKAEKGEKK